MTYQLKAKEDAFLMKLVQLCAECDAELYLAWDNTDCNKRHLCIGFNGTDDLIEFDSADKKGVHNVVVHEANRSLSVLTYPENLVTIIQ